MADESNIARRSVPVPGASCIIRMGDGAISTLGSACATTVGKPQRALLVYTTDEDAERVEAVRRELTSAMFFVTRLELDSAALRDLNHARLVFDALAEGGLTTDDVLVAVGDVDVLSLAIWSAANWCGGMPMAAVPTTLLAAIECTHTPRGLDLGDLGQRIFSPRAYARVMVCDLAHMDCDPTHEQTRLAFACMVASAVADGTKPFGRLAERAESIASGDLDAIGEQLLDTMKSRGRLACSNALAIRQSLEYGQTFADALGELCCDLPSSACLSEALRFSARLAAGAAEGDVDLVFSQDGMLDRLGLGEVAITVDADALIERLKAIRFSTTNRFMLPLPLKFGRVRQTIVEDADLKLHLGAWTKMAARRTHEA